MKISTKVQYGLRAMAYLARNSKEGRTISVREISYKEKISADYLEKIIAKLEKSGLLNAKKGVKGGYLMAKPSRDIKIIEIFRAIENPKTKVKCLDDKCCLQETCLVRNLWYKMQTILDDFLESMTLEDLVNKNL